MTCIRATSVFGVVLAALAVVSAGCGGDVDLLPVGKARLVDYSHSEECVRPGSPLGLDLGGADVEVEVNGLEVVVEHKNAILNCCLDSILVSFEQQGKLLKLVERESVTMPCDCICPFEVVAEIEVSAPGDYLIEVWTEARLVWSGEVEVGGRR
jgi:hypothetical protein